MNSREVVNKLFEDSGIPMVQYADMLGISRATLWDRLRSKKLKEMTAGMLSDMVGVLGYRVVIVKNGSRIQGEAYVLD